MLSKFAPPNSSHDSDAAPRHSMLASLLLVGCSWMPPAACGLLGVLLAACGVLVGARGSVGIYAADTQAGTPRRSSARRAVLLLNQGFGVKFKDAIALIINYLGATFGGFYRAVYRLKH